MLRRNCEKTQTITPRFPLKFFLCVLILLSITGCKEEPQKAENHLFRFVFLGDTRGDYKADPPQYFNAKPLKQFVKRIVNLEPKPDFVIFNGDMVAKTAYTNAPEEIERFNTVFLKPFKKNGITVYITPGNHVIDQKKDNLSNSAAEYITMFNSNFPSDNPMNGPGQYKGVTYSFTHKNCHFVTVTSFVSHRGDDNTELNPEDFVQKKKDFEYFVNRENRQWLIEDLRADESKFRVFFTHCPLYPVGPHYEDKKSLHAHKSNRDAVAGILTDNEIDLVLASHEHLYARVNLGPGNPEVTSFNASFPQVIVGSASAPVGEKEARNDMKFEKCIFDYAIMIVDVGEDNMVCNVYNQKGRKLDDFIVTSGN